MRLSRLLAGAVFRGLVTLQVACADRLADANGSRGAALPFVRRLSYPQVNLTVSSNDKASLSEIGGQHAARPANKPAKLEAKNMGNDHGKKHGGGDGKRSKKPVDSSTEVPEYNLPYNFEEFAKAAEIAEETVKKFGDNQWARGEDWAKEFAEAVLASEPYEAYQRTGNEIDERGFGEEDGIITGRSLLLNRFSSFEDIDGDDNYVTCLGLSAEDLKNLGETKAKLLDVGCGDSIFPAEAHLFGFTVQGIDLHATNDLSRRQKVFNQYAKSHLFAECVKRYKGREPKCSVGQPALRARCVQGLRSTESKYLSNPPTTGDCTNLKDALPDDSQFDGVVCSFVFMYLPRKDALKALNEMARVSKPGGWIRILEGDANPGKGLPLEVKVDGITEVPTKGRLRVFQVQK